MAPPAVVWLRPTGTAATPSGPCLHFVISAVIMSVPQALHCQTVYREPQSAMPQSMAVSVGGQASRRPLGFPGGSWRATAHP